MSAALDAEREARVGDLEVEVATLRDLIEVYENAMVTQSERVDQLLRALRRSNEDLDRFAYAASHDLKAPLRGIGTIAGWIEEDYGRHFDERAREQMALLRRRLHRMEDLINGILAYSRVGRKSAPPEEVEVGRMLSDVVDLISPKPGMAVVATSPLPRLVTHAPPLQQVFMNLVGNAVKYHDRSEGRIEVSCRDQGEAYAFRVADDGPGIAPEFHERIFGMFERLHSRDEIEGTGLGLALVRRIVETQGGSIHVESEGRGSAFVFTWPKAPPAE